LQRLLEGRRLYRSEDHHLVAFPQMLLFSHCGGQYDHKVLALPLNVQNRYFMHQSTSSSKLSCDHNHMRPQPNSKGIHGDPARYAFHKLRA
jgi:hypothetical protein